MAAILGALEGILPLLSRVLGPLGAIFGGSKLGGLFGSVATSTASIFKSVISAAGRIASKAIGKIPLEGSIAVLLYILACNADLIYCNKPTAQLGTQLANMVYTQLMSSGPLYNPQPPPTPPEYMRPKIVPQTQAAGMRLMSYQPLPGFNIVHACPWISKGVAVQPTVMLSYQPSETLILSRAGTQSGY